MKTLLPLLSFVLLACHTGYARASEADSKPNIVFILADDLGYGDLGCYGQQQIKTPHIDRLATEGMRFTDFYSGSTVCAPARCTLMTGLHTGHCLIRGNRRVDLRAEDVTVAELLKESGYTTALCGKWGLGREESSGLPTRQGFDFFYGYLDQAHAHNYYPTFLIRNDKRELLDNVVPDEGRAGQGVATEKVTYSHDLIMAEALKFIELNKDKPFFLYLALTIPHANNEAGQLGMEVPSFGDYQNEDWPDPEKGRAAMISYMDKDVGRLMTLLKKMDLDKRTIVIFSSDNGPHNEGGSKSEFFRSSGSLRGTKRDLFEGGIRVPMIVRWPDRVPAGSESSHIGAFWDFMPTAADIAGVATQKSHDGISFYPTLVGQQQGEHEYLYWEFHERGKSQAVRFGNWKAVRKLGKPLMLFNLDDDPGEKDDLADRFPDIVKQAERYLAEAHSESELWPLSAKKR